MGFSFLSYSLFVLQDSFLISASCDLQSVFFPKFLNSSPSSKLKTKSPCDACDMCNFCVTRHRRHIFAFIIVDYFCWFLCVLIILIYETMCSSGLTFHVTIQCSQKRTYVRKWRPETPYWLPKFLTPTSVWRSVLMGCRIYIFGLIDLKIWENVANNL